MKTKKCFGCKTKKEIVYTITKNEAYCRECFDENFFSCYSCSRGCKREADTFTFDSNEYCQKCYEASFRTCDECNDTFHRDDMRWVGDEKCYCDQCLSGNFSYCDPCGEYYANDDISDCVRCGEYFCEAHITYSLDEPDHRYCEDCSEPQTNQVGYFETRRPRLNFPDSPPAKVFKNINRFVGIEFEAENGNGQEAQENVPRDCGICHDGSLDNGLEVQTPPRKGQALVEMIVETTKALKEADFQPSVRAGMHVHIDARDFVKHPRKLSRVLKTVYVTEDILFSMLPPSRWKNHYCQPLNSVYRFKELRTEVISKIKLRVMEDKVLTCPASSHLHSLACTPNDCPAFNHQHESSCIEVVKKTPRRVFRDCWFDNQKLYVPAIKEKTSHYNALNVQQLFDHGTLEFRHHASTLNPIKVKNWVKLLLTLVDYSEHKYKEADILTLLKTPYSKTKLDLFYKVFRIDSSLKKYIDMRVTKFNPSFTTVLKLQNRQQAEDN